MHILPHPAQPQHTNHWAPRTRKRHQQEHRPQRPTERSDPTQHAKGRTGDCPGPRKGATPRRNVTRGGGGGSAWKSNFAKKPVFQAFFGLSYTFVHVLYATQALGSQTPPPPHSRTAPQPAPRRTPVPRPHPLRKCSLVEPDDPVPPAFLGPSRLRGHRNVSPRCAGRPGERGRPTPLTAWGTHGGPVGFRAQGGGRGGRWGGGCRGGCMGGEVGGGGCRGGR